MSGRNRKNYRGRMGNPAHPADANNWAYDNDTTKEILESFLRMGIENGDPVSDPPPSFDVLRDNYFKPSGNMNLPNKPKTEDTVKGIMAWQEKMSKTLGPDGLPLYRRPDGSPGPIDGKFGEWSKAAAKAYAAMPAAPAAEPTKEPVTTAPPVPPAQPTAPSMGFRVGDGTPDVAPEVKVPRPGDQMTPRTGDGTPVVTTPRRESRPEY